MSLRVAVVGVGLMGRRRAAIVKDAGEELVVVADIDPVRAKEVAAELGCEATTDWLTAATHEDADLVIVSTTNDSLTPVATAALEAGKDVLCEKPLGHTPEECEAAVRAAEASGRVLKVGFNHRYHPAVREALARTHRGEIGGLVFLRCRYGHGGRAGYEREWRMDPAVAGGGELLDQGMHAIDLFRACAGEFDQALGWVGSSVWSSDVEDNAFALFRQDSGLVASLHASWTQWRNLFSLEIFGREGYLVVEGLGGSYGTERLVHGRRRSEGAPPEEEVREFPGPDGSWELEWKGFRAALASGCEPEGSGRDALEAVRMVHAVYESSGTGSAVRLR